MDGPTGVAAALLLARWWSRPTLEELDTWTRLWPDAHAAALSLELDPAVVAQLQTAAEGANTERLADEYERLLVGPGRAPCPPYESLWRADVPDHERETLMGAAADAVQGVYRELGAVVRSDGHELPDHLLIELEALAYALDRGAGESAAALVRDHLAQWTPAFCAAVAGETDQPFYRALAALTPAWTAALAG